MSLKTQLKYIPIEDYLEGEELSDIKHEYIDGQVYAMVGASRRHNRIALDFASALTNHLRGSPCKAYISDMKVRIDNVFYYPDMVIACHAGGHDYYETEPVVIVEVLSPSTESKDRLEKRLTYQRLASLQEYVLVAQDKVQVDIYRRTAEGWELEQCDERDVLRLDALDFTLPVLDIYRDAMNII
ncbi:MAG: Uma2 family endonuclease [Pseudomonadota bacterium]